MILRECRFFSFRNLVDQGVTFGSGANLFVGQNGQGKTNLMEGIALLSQGRSFRTNRHRELIRWQRESASVFGKVEHRVGDEELGVVIEGDRRTAFVNQEAVRPLSAYLGRLPSVTFTPDDLAVVKGGPAQRRALIDRHLVDVFPGLLGVMMNYQRALRNKNALLKGGDARPSDLTPWNEILAENGIALMNARREFSAKLEREAYRHHTRFSGSDQPLELRWRESLNPRAGEVSLQEVQEIFSQSITRELRSKSTLVGPHRDDLLIALGGHDAKLFASQGQSRSIILALKLGIIDLIESAREESPLILLDDVDSELDRGRAERLFEVILGTERQTFITGTELAGRVSESLATYNMFEVTEGSVTPVEKV